MRGTCMTRLLVIVAVCSAGCVLTQGGLTAQDTPPAAAPVRQEMPLPPAPGLDATPLPINLPTALQLANVRPLDIAVASQRLQVAAAQLDRANVLWLPTILVGVDYARQDGRIQDIQGNVFSTSRSSIMVGAGPTAVFAVSDALYGPLVARQVERARRADVQTATNDSMLAVAEAYFNVQQARGELAGASDAARRVEELVGRAETLAPGIIPAVEVSRARTELSRRRQAVESAHDRWQAASADLTRLLRLQPTAQVVPVEPPHLRVDLIATDRPVDDLIPVALASRPELASRQAAVQATLARLRHERLRPLVPSVLLRGNATNPAGTLSSGAFGGGVDGNLSNFGGRNSIDLQVLWEFQNLGFGNRAAVRERQAESQVAVLELFQVQDRVAAEVVQAHSQARRAANRVREAEAGVRDAVETADQSVRGLGQTRRAGELVVLVFRPQEVVAALQSLALAYDDYYRAVADANRAPFRLYRALGQPAQCVIQVGQVPTLAATIAVPGSPASAPGSRPASPRTGGAGTATEPMGPGTPPAALPSPRPEK